MCVSDGGDSSVSPTVSNGTTFCSLSEHRVSNLDP